MFFDDIVFIVLDVAGSYDTCLGVWTHLLAVDVEAGLGLALENAFCDESLEIFFCSGIDFI